MSSFTCRRAIASDVTAVRTLVEQQRLAGVRYSDPPHPSHGSTAATAAAAGSSSSLFAARAASNAFHLRSLWGAADIASLLSNQWLTAVVSDGDELLCVACFHYQPSQHSLDGTAHSSPAATGGGGRQARDWPSWLPHSLQCVSPSSAAVASFQPSACRFLTYFACCTVNNTRAERALVDCLLKLVFDCDSSVSQLLALRPHTEPHSPVDNTPLCLSFTSLEEPSAAMSGARPTSVTATTAASATAGGELLICWRALRSSLWPTLTVRRGRLEDHDDLLPLFARQQQQQHQQQQRHSAAVSLGEARVQGSAVTLLPLWSRSSLSTSVSPLELLSSADCVSLVAECGGRAVGLLSVVAGVDVARLSEQFVFEHASQPASSLPASSAAQLHDVCGDEWSSAPGLPSSVLRYLRLAYNALLSAGGTCALPPASRLTSLSVEASQQQQQQQHQLTAGVDWPMLLQLLVATSTDAIQRNTDRQVEPHTATELASAIQGWASIGDNADGGSSVARLATESDFVRLCSESVALVHGETSDSRWLPSLVGLWLDCLDQRLPPVALHCLREMQRQQHSYEKKAASAEGASAGKAFAVSCFVLSDEHRQRAEQFIPAAFAALPHLDWMLLSAPHNEPHTPLMAHMTQLQARPHKQHDAAQAVYALHKYTAISALSPMDAMVSVRRAEQSDLPALTTLLTAQSAAEFGLQSLLPSAESEHHSHAAQLSALAAASSAVRVEVQRVRRCVGDGSAACLVVTCAGEMVGMLRTQRLQSSQQLLALQAHYHTAHISDGWPADEHCRASAAEVESDASHGHHLLIRSFVLHPLFTCHTSLVLQETMRQCAARALHYTVSGDQRHRASSGSTRVAGIRPAGSFSAALLRCMHQQAPVVVPAAALPQHDKYDSLHMPAAAANGSASHNSAGLSIAGEAAGGTERTSRAGHDDDTAVTPGPPLFLPHFSHGHGSDQSRPQQSHRSAPGPISAATATSISCPACSTLACPTFALHSLTPPSLSASRRLVSQRIVFIGASETALSALISLLTGDSTLYFTSLTLVSLEPLPALQARDSSVLPAAVSAVPSSDFHVDGAMLQRVCLDARVRLVTGRVVDIDSARQLLTVQLKAAQWQAVEETLLVPYDELVVASGAQPVRPAISQQFRSAHTTQASVLGHARVDGSGVSLRQPVEAVATPNGGLSQQPLAQSQPQHATAASTLPTTRLQPTDWSDVSGVWPLSSLEHAVAFLTASMPQLLPSSFVPLAAPPASPPAIVVSGASLSALSAICGLLSLGVAGDCICWVHPHSNLTHLSGPPSSTTAVSNEPPASLSLSAAVLGDELPLMAAVLNTLAEERIRIVQRVTVAALQVDAGHAATGGGSNHTHGGDDSDGASDGHPVHSSHRHSGNNSGGPRALQSVVLSNGDVLPCSLLLLCDCCEVDDRLMEVAVRRLGLVHDGRFVVDEHFRSASLPNVRLAGPMAKFQRGLLPHATDAAAAAGSSSAAELGVQLLDHAFYSSACIGRALAAEIHSAALLQHSKSQSPPRTQQQPVTTALFSSLHAVSCVRRTVLPGPVAYFHAWSPAYSPRPSTMCERALSQSFASYSFSLHVCTATLRIVRIRYWGSFELLAAHNLTRLIGLPVTYCNRLLWRWETGQIRTLLLFLQQDWAQMLYSPAFSHFRRQLVAGLTQQYAGQLKPVMDKLISFQRTMQLDQQRRHERQQLQQQRRGSNIKVVLLQSTQTSDTSIGDIDVSALQALDAFLPAQLKETTHRAVLSFIVCQQQSLPAALRQPLTLRHVM